MDKAIKELNSELYRLSFENTAEYYIYIETKAKQEFVRIYEMDKTLESLAKRNILVMFRLNQRHRFVPFETFGINIKLF